MTDVFISYKRRKRAQIEQIARRLEDLGVAVWFDAELEPGATFSETIAREVRTAKCVLVCFTNDVFPHGGDENGWVLGEATIGRNRKVLVSTVLEPTDLDPPWNTIHAENLTELGTPAGEDNWRSVLLAVGRHIGRPGLAEYYAAIASQSGERLRAWVRKYPGDKLAPPVLARLAQLNEEEEEPTDPTSPSAIDNIRLTPARHRNLGATLASVVVVAILGTAVMMWAINGRLPSLNAPTTPGVIASSEEEPDPNDILWRTDRARFQSSSEEVAVNATILAKNNLLSATGDTTETVLAITESADLENVLLANGFTEAMVDAVRATLVNVFPSPVIEAGSHLRILFGPSRSGGQIPYRLSLYERDPATNADTHRASVALTDRGTYVLSLAPPPIDFDDAIASADPDTGR